MKLTNFDSRLYINKIIYIYNNNMTFTAEEMITEKNLLFEEFNCGELYEDLQILNNEMYESNKLISNISINTLKFNESVKIYNENVKMWFDRVISWFKKMWFTVTNWIKKIVAKIVGFILEKKDLSKLYEKWGNQRLKIKKKEPHLRLLNYYFTFPAIKVS